MNKKEPLSKNIQRSTTHENILSTRGFQEVVASYLFAARPVNISRFLSPTMQNSEVFLIV
jgi:hypothetical protein